MEGTIYCCPKTQSNQTKYFCLCKRRWKSIEPYLSVFLPEPFLSRKSRCFNKSYLRMSQSYEHQEGLCSWSSWETNGHLRSRIWRRHQDTPHLLAKNRLARRRKWKAPCALPAKSPAARFKRAAFKVPNEAAKRRELLATTKLSGCIQHLNMDRDWCCVNPWYPKAWKSRCVVLLKGLLINP